MPNERYPGEQQGLRLFLEALLPVVDELDEAGLLHHAVRRALRSGDLDRLRHARQIFNHLPRAQRQALSAAMLQERRPALAPQADAGEPALPAAPMITFEAAEDGGGVTLGLRQEAEPSAAVRVSIHPGTLPSAAAERLRRIAAIIEADRRLLSARYWHGRDARSEQRDVR